MKVGDAYPQITQITQTQKTEFAQLSALTLRTLRLGGFAGAFVIINQIETRDALNRSLKIT
jgi:hypothetical protein